MKLSLILAALMLALAPATTTFASPVHAEATAIAAKARTVTFVVENMTCALCPITVKRAMEAVEGVQSVLINYEARTATVQFNPAAVSPQSIAAASTGAGYPAAVQD